MTKTAVISTFAGCGGSSLGYLWAGYRELLAVEWDDHAVETLKVNFPELKVHHGDICDLSIEQCLALAGIQPGELDVLDGSPPCQGFSLAGTRNYGDTRNRLFEEYVRLLAGLRPKVFVMENVAGMIKGKMRAAFREILLTLKSAGYQVRCCLMNAMHYGVAQSRERLIFIGVCNDLTPAPSHPKPMTRPLSIRSAIGDLGDTPDPARDHVWIDESPAGRNTKTWQLARRAKQGKKYAGQQRRYEWNKPAGTLTKPAHEAQAMPPYLRSVGCHPLYTRTFSLLEYKRLASFPDDFKFPGDWKWGFYRIGNCVPPLMMKAIAQHVRSEMLERIEA
ncbi:DNA cytosine methyltransferase [Candidatus Sumerlaeota bacterium]|nr:DNA cytosine methyltransferase [Candidatus Sumerlaeota bacterium]